tara:strand:+ start:664 stop:921 length:258 start_codon:yes stop_codon:yes gene_type:complete
MSNRKLIVPEDLVIEIMGIVSQLGRTANDYHRRILGEDNEAVIKVYERIIHKLMDLDEYGEENNSLSDMLDSFGIKLGDKNDGDN